MVILGTLKKGSAALILAAMLAGGSASAAQAVAQESASADDTGLASPELTDLRALTCWEVITLTEDDRAFAMSLLYGYAKGVDGDASLSPRNVQVAIINTMLNCVDEPDTLVLNLLREHIANEE